ncbi:MAG: T9SS type A sorting domain-containing protein [Bacteroidota bacterium]|nr:T9SS type A sorting domain-containing protein [Bacteroidota bacterium]
MYSGKVMKAFYKEYLILSVGLVLGWLSSYAQTPLVYLECGVLKYTPYANQGETNTVNRIPDFSNAGYRGGGISLPVVQVVKTVNPVSGESHKVIQDAIDEVSALPADANGMRGAVLLKKGVYVLSDSAVIRTSGVVLRGEGSGTDGTVIIATAKKQCTPVHISGTGSGYGEVAGSRVKITSAYVGTGTLSFDVAAGHSFVAGDNVVIQKIPNDAWITLLDMAQYGWLAKDYKVTFERKIIKVEGNTLTINIPVVDPFQDAYGGAEIFKSNITGRVSNCGIENLRVESYYAGEEDENHGWNAIMLERAENCWVKGVVAKFFAYTCVNVSDQSVFNTVEDCAMIDPKAITTGGRKYSFNLEYNSSCNLFNRCVTWGGRHDYVTGSRVPGPNVFLDCDAENTFADIGPHHRWATGLLFDNIRGGQIHVQNRKDMGSGHGWAGAQTLFWNCNSYKDDIKVESPPSARNFGIGCIGLTKNGAGYWESWGTSVSPRSLYLKQLEERLGTQAVNNITTEAQRVGNIWTSLKISANEIVAQSKVDIPTSVIDVQKKEETMSVSYNSGTIRFSINEQVIVNAKDITVFDVRGRVLFRTNQPKVSGQLQVGNLSKGLYFLIITSGEQGYKSKFMVN